MSNTSIVKIEPTDTFQNWFNTTNDLVDIINENVMLAGPGGFTIQGDSTLEGSFTAESLTSNTGSVETLSITTLSRKTDQNQAISSISPLNITSITENILNLETPSGYRPIVRLINGGSARWSIGHETAVSNSPILIQVEGAATPQLTLTQTGRLTVSELQGDGSLITNITASNVEDLDASKITTGVFSADRIPSLDASKITSGTISALRIPSLDASKITTGTIDAARIPNLDASKITTGTLNAARIPSLDASKITTGALDAARIPSLDASKITTGALDAARIPNLDASKITSGTISALRIPNLDASKITTGVLNSARVPPAVSSSSYTTDGFANLTGGLQFRWGYEVSSTDAAQTFTFDSAFDNVCIGVIATISTANTNDVLNVSDKTRTGFTVDRKYTVGGSPTFFYFAIGY